MPSQTFKKVARILGGSCVALHENVGKRTNNGGERRLATRHELRCDWCRRSATRADLWRASGRRLNLLQRAQIFKDPFGTFDEKLTFIQVINVLCDDA